jgi:hypothetical protein
MEQMKLDQNLAELKASGFNVEKELLKEGEMSLCSIRAIRSDGGICRWYEDDGRLAQLIVILSARIKNVSDKIDYLEDHCGCLTVHWKERPTTWERTTVKKAWEFFSEDCVSHEFIIRMPIEQD